MEEGNKKKIENLMSFVKCLGVILHLAITRIILSLFGYFLSHLFLTFYYIIQDLLNISAENSKIFKSH